MWIRKYARKNRKKLPQKLFVKLRILEFLFLKKEWKKIVKPKPLETDLWKCFSPRIFHLVQLAVHSLPFFLQLLLFYTPSSFK